jgi:hypothetical protein
MINNEMRELLKNDLNMLLNREERKKNNSEEN